ncbi:MAG TPA: hypothetical protein VHL10_03865, partial [Nitrososphaera sp.]|nr:hypothetical protein [Nitrososphaera sp.]
IKDGVDDKACSHGIGLGCDPFFPVILIEPIKDRFSAQQTGRCRGQFDSRGMAKFIVLKGKMAVRNSAVCQTDGRDADDTVRDLLSSF